MKVPRRSTGAVCAFFLVAVVAAGCGDSIPANSVAKVGDSPITRTQFQHWMTVFAKSSSTSSSGSTTVPVPPDYTACIAAKRTAAAKSKSKARPTNTQLTRQCSQEYSQLRDQSLGLLIAAQWLQGEAADQGIKVTDTEVDKQIETQRKQQYPKKADFDKALKQSGFTMADLRFQTRLQQLQEKLVNKISKGSDKVSQAAIASYYEKNKSRFGSPAQRDVRIVLTKDRAKAVQAKNAIEHGQSFSSVAKKYSTDQGSKSQGGKLTVTKGQQEPAFDTAVFAAKKGQLLGPVKTQFGYYVVRIDKITAATQQSLKEATPTIKQVLQQQNQQKAVSNFSEQYRKKWTAKTDCRKGFVIQGCKNAPKASSTAATSGASTGQ